MNTGTGNFNNSGAKRSVKPGRITTAQIVKFQDIVLKDASKIMGIQLVLRMLIPEKLLLSVNPLHTNVSEIKDSISAEQYKHFLELLNS